MANYDVTITNGSGSQVMKNGTYTVSATSATGYDLTSLSPTTFTVSSSSSGSGAFTLTANGTLTLTFNETGASGGTAVTSGTVEMTNSDGSVVYSSVEDISATGSAVFENVPYGSSSQPYVLYFKQLTTDDTHNIEENIITVSMDSQTKEVYVQNTTATTQQISLTNSVYPNLEVSSAQLTFTGS
jgi:hypothetical protein